MSAAKKITTRNSALGARLDSLFSKESKGDSATRAVIEHIDQTQSRIEAVREEVSRGLRSGNRRFRL